MPLLFFGLAFIILSVAVTCLSAVHIAKPALALSLAFASFGANVYIIISELHTQFRWRDVKKRVEAF